MKCMQVGDHGTAALAISLPFACVLGLFSSLTTTKMVSRRYVWIYSAVQFLFIVLFTHIFYRYVRTTLPCLALPCVISIHRLSTTRCCLNQTKPN